ncbi:MAG: hypothetical protein H7A23_16840 [Leptospiraceae bacterium]|nr:hypothetical protein [Leptospiraceae bacterium]MCP5496214.1 hypothetical protein [Leptospiraceae bacterium]
MESYKLNFLDRINLIFLEPDSIPRRGGKLEIESDYILNIFVFLSALSISVGGFYLTSSDINVVFILASTTIHWLCLSVLPYILSPFIDFFAQMKDKSGKTKDILVYMKYSTLVFLLFTPLAMLFKAFAIKNVFGLMVTFLVVSLMFAYNTLRGMNLIYDLENPISMRIFVLSSGFLFAIPMILSWFLFAFLLLAMR